MSSPTIKLINHNWQLPALLSLVTAVVASIYATTASYQQLLAILVYSASLIAGLWSVAQQLRAARAKVINFGKEHWQRVGDDLILEIESDFMLFRVEIRKDANTYHEVGTVTETSNDGKITRIYVGAKTPDKLLVGRVVVR